MNNPDSRPADVTVVTVTYNGADLVTTCLDALAAQDLGDVRMDVVVVDNASGDGTRDRVEQHPLAARLVVAERNLGFASGNNLVLRSIGTPFVLLLNNDAQPEPDFVRHMVHAMRASGPRVAALAARVLLADRFRAAGPDDVEAVLGPDGAWVLDPAGDVRLLNSTGNTVRTDGFGVDRGWLCDASREDPDICESEVFGFSGAAAIIRTSALRDVGYFDDRFFMYYEDTDLSWRLRLAGYVIRYCREAVVSHVHAASSGEGSEFFRFHDTRNRLAMLTKDASAGLAGRMLLRSVLTTVSIAIRRSQPWPYVVVRVRATASYARMLPALLVERRRIGLRARVGRREVERLLVEPGSHTAGGYRTS